MNAFFLWMVVLIVDDVGRCGVINSDDRAIKFNFEAVVPKSQANLGKLRVEFYLDFWNVNKSFPMLKAYRDCNAVPSSSGSVVYLINVNGYSMPVYCEVFPNGSNFLVIQRRLNRDTNFYRNWTEYERGFGDLSSEFWIGNAILHHVTSEAKYKLRIEMEANDLTRAYAEYSSFSVGSSENKYKLNVSGYSGNAGDSLGYHNGQNFSTFDYDNDVWSGNCAVEYKGAWWYNACHKSNLNGFYYGGHQTSFADGVNWFAFKGYYESLTSVVMKISKVGK